MSLARILIVDDDPGVRASLLMVLKFADYEVYEASSGAEALALAQSHYPDLIVSDINMPDLNGIQTVEALRRLPHVRNLPVIFISGLASEEHQRKIATLGAAELLTKPFSIQELMELIEKSLNEGSSGSST
jgi:CheY-like chemotaxis protein